MLMMDDCFTSRCFNCEADFSNRGRNAWKHRVDVSLASILMGRRMTNLRVLSSFSKVQWRFDDRFPSSLSRWYHRTSILRQYQRCWSNNWDLCHSMFVELSLLPSEHSHHRWYLNDRKSVFLSRIFRPRTNQVEVEWVSKNSAWLIPVIPEERNRVFRSFADPNEYLRSIRLSVGSEQMFSFGGQQLFD